MDDTGLKTTALDMYVVPLSHAGYYVTSTPFLEGVKPPLLLEGVMKPPSSLLPLRGSLNFPFLHLWLSALELHSDTIGEISVCVCM